jgi:hypothetical protein
VLSRASRGSAVNIRKSSDVVPTGGSGGSNIISPSRVPFITLEQEFQLCERSLGPALEKARRRRSMFLRDRPK